MPTYYQHILVFVFYTLCGWIGIEYAGIGEGSLTLIWLPSGIALAACIIYGKSILPFIWFGSFIANSPYLINDAHAYPVLYAAFFGAIAASINTFVQAYLAYFLYEKFIGNKKLESSRLVIDFILKVTLVPSAINMALLIGIYSLGGFTSFNGDNIVTSVICTWLSGVLADFHGYFVIVPFILSWHASKRCFISIPNLWHFLTIAGYFSLLFIIMVYNFEAIYFLLVLGVLVALYATMRMATTFVLFTSLFFTFATAQSAGPFLLDTHWHAFISLLMFVLSMGLAIYIVATKRQELNEFHRLLEEKVNLRTKKLNQANEQLTNISQTDGLTGIANRRCFDQFLDNEWARAIRNNRSISLLMIDIDFFKQFNDIYGHVKGDDCLKLIANAAQSVVKRPSDLIARYGGEEFAVVLPETRDSDAIAEQIRSAISNLQIPHQGSNINDFVTVSIGCCTIKPTKGVVSSHLIELTDKALYLAKDSGRNNVKVSSTGLKAVNRD